MSSCGHMKECKQIQKQLGDKLGFFYCTSHKFQGARGGANGVYLTRSKKQASCIDIIVYRKIWKMNETLNKNFSFIFATIKLLEH